MDATMEVVMDAIFSSCDPENTETARVSKIIEYITPFMQTHLSELRELKRLLNCNDSSDENVSKNTFKEAMKSWVAKYQEPLKSEVQIADTSLFGDCEDNLSKLNVGEKLLEGYASGIINIPACGDVLKDKVFLEDRVKELEHLNRKLENELMHNKTQEQISEETIEHLKMSLHASSQKLTNSKLKTELLERDLTDFDELKEQYAKLNKKAVKMETLLHNAEKDLLHLKQKNEYLNNEKQSLVDRINLKNIKEHDFERSIHFIQDQLKEKSDLVELLNSDNEVLKDNNSEQQRVAEELQNIIDVLKSERLKTTTANIKNKNGLQLKSDNPAKVNIKKDSTALTCEKTDEHSTNLNLLAELQSSFDTNTLQGQLDAIEHRCCKESKKRLSHQIEALNRQNEDQKDCIKMYIDQVRDLQQTIKDNLSRELNFTSVVEDLKAKLKKQEKSSMDKDLEINKLNLNMAELDSYASKVKEEFEKNFLKTKDLEITLNDLQSKRTTHMETIDNLEKEVEILNDCKLSLEEQNQNLKHTESECDFFKNKYDSLEENQKELENKLSATNKDKDKLQVTILQLKTTVQNLEKQNKDITDNNNDLLKESEALNKKLDSRIKELQVNHERKLEELTTSLDLKKMDFERFAHELSVSQRKISAVTDEKKQLALQINLLEVRVNETNKWNHTLTQEKQNLNDELTVCGKKLKNREDQHASLKIKYTELSRQRADCSKTIEDFDRKLRILDAEVKRLKDINEDLKQNVDKARQAEFERDRIKLDLSKTLSETKDNIVQLEARIETLHQNNEDMQINNDSLKAENRNLQNQMYDLEKANAVSTTSCDNCIKLVEQLRVLNEKSNTRKSICHKCKQTNLETSLATKHTESYAKQCLRLEKLQNKLEIKDNELIQCRANFERLQENLCSGNTRTNSSEDLDFIIRQLSVDKIIAQSALHSFVIKWRTALEKIPKAEELLQFVENEEESDHKRFSHNYKEVHTLSRYIKFIVLSLTIVSDIKPNLLENLMKDTTKKFALKPAVLNYDLLKSEIGKGDSLLNNSEMEEDDLFHNTIEASPSLTDAVLESLQLNSDSSETLSDRALEYRICQLMVSFRLDGETVAGRMDAQAHVRSRYDAQLLDTMQLLMKELQAAQPVGGSDWDRLPSMQKQLHQINVLCCRTVQSAEQLGALRQEKKMQKSIQLITNYVAKLERIIAELKNKKVNIKPRKSLTNIQPKFSILRSLESGTQTYERQPKTHKRNYMCLAVVVTLFVAVWILLKGSISQNIIPWNLITWDEIVNQIFHVHYLTGRPT